MQTTSIPASAAQRAQRRPVTRRSRFSSRLRRASSALTPVPDDRVAASAGEVSSANRATSAVAAG